MNEEDKRTLIRQYPFIEDMLLYKNKAIFIIG